MLPFYFIIFQLAICLWMLRIQLSISSSLLYERADNFSLSVPFIIAGFISSNSFNYILKWPSEVINTFKNAWGCCLSPNVVSLIPERRRREGINETKCGDKQHPNAFLKVLHYRQQGHFNIVNFFLLPVFDNEQLLLFHYEMNTFYSHRHFVKSCWFEYLVVVLLSLKK